MDSSTPTSNASRRQSNRDLAAMFLETLDPTTGWIPQPMTPKRGRYGGTSLAVFSRNPKHRAIARVEFFPLWQCCRMLLTLYINFGRGERCRSWRSDESIAELMARSGMGTYSVHHVRRCRRLLEDLGLIRSTYVAPHSHYGCAGADKCKAGHWPSSRAPDVDGGGLRARSGGNVVEVNLTAILSMGPLWEGPLREMGWQDARERCEHDEPPAAPASGPQLVALDGGGGLVDELEDDDQAEAAAPAIAPPADPASAPEGGIMDAHGGVITDAHPCDLGSPPGNLSRDPGAATSIAPRARALPGTDTPAHAGGFESETHAALEAARAVQPAPSLSGPRRLEPDARSHAHEEPTTTSRPRGEQRTNEEQAARQRLAVTAAMDPESLARLRKLCPDVDLSWASPRVVPLRGGGGSSSSSAPPAPPARSPRLFDDTGPIGRHGERPPGWRPPPGGGGRN
jgi:hypothetical protein